MGTWSHGTRATACASARGTIGQRSITHAIEMKAPSFALYPVYLASWPITPSGSGDKIRTLKRIVSRSAGLLDWTSFGDALPISACRDTESGRFICDASKHLVEEALRPVTSVSMDFVLIQPLIQAYSI